MTARLDSDHGRCALRVRRTTVEPLFGQTKHQRRIDTFSRRGITSDHHEWQLIAATSNLLKLHRFSLGDCPARRAPARSSD
jgi:hypothetical protein